MGARRATFGPSFRRSSEMVVIATPSTETLGRLDAGCPFEAELGDGDLAHLELLDLAGDGHRELVGRLPVAGDLEVGKALPAEVSEFVVGGTVALAEREPGHQLLAHARVRHP